MPCHSSVFFALTFYFVVKYHQIVRYRTPRVKIAQMYLPVAGNANIRNNTHRASV
jgi:hypothetical protein